MVPRNAGYRRENRTMRTWLARRLARFARKIGGQRDNWDNYSVWTASGEANRNTFFSTVRTEINGLLPRLEFDFAGPWAVIHSVWYDRRTDAIRITFASPNYNRWSQEFRSEVVKQILEENNDNSR